MIFIRFPIDFQDALIQATEAVEYHEHFDGLFERYNQWIKDAEHRLDKLITTIENHPNYDLEQHYRSIEVMNLFLIIIS